MTQISLTRVCVSTSSSSVVSQPVTGYTTKSFNHSDPSHSTFCGPKIMCTSSSSTFPHRLTTPFSLSLSLSRNKAVSDGAISYLDRVLRMVCGDFYYIPYDSSDPGHVRRQGNTDPLSTADVVQKVNVLNQEIFQAAALLGEMLQNMEHTGTTKEQIT